jgi:NADH-ubiquinone oxidoreductase chain 6
MNSDKYLFLLNEIYTNGYTDYILDIISGLAVISGISVIISKNPIVSVLHLIALFAYVSFYLIIIGLNFIGLSYLIVYIGAVSILFLFILMLINIRTSELQSNTSNSIPLTILIGIVISYFLFQMLPYGILISSHLNDSNLNENLYTIQIAGGQDNNINGLNADKNDLFFITSKIWDGALAESNHITSIGNVMYTNYNIWLILASFILLLAMVGAIVITIGKGRGPSSELKGGNTRSPSSLNTNSRRYYSTSRNVELSPDWVCGFVDGDGSFNLSISKSKNLKTGWFVLPAFAIELKARDLPLLEKIQSFFGVGSIKANRNQYKYVVNSVQDIHNVIIPFFTKHPLLTSKYISFLLFQQAITLMIEKKHLTLEGVQLITSIRASMNNGVFNKKSRVATSELENVTPVALPSVDRNIRELITNDWLTGFTDAEGSFSIQPTIKSTGKRAVAVRYSLVQHSNEYVLIEALKSFIGCGSIYIQNNVIYLLIQSTKDFTEHVLPIFLNHSLQSGKVNDFLDFNLALTKINNNEHLTDEGFAEMEEIKSRMNNSRVE